MDLGSPRGGFYVLRGSGPPRQPQIFTNGGVEKITVLGNDREPLADLIRIEPVKRLIPESDFPGSIFPETEKQTGNGALACTAGSDNGDGSASGNGEGDI